MGLLLRVGKSHESSASRRNLPGRPAATPDKVRPHPAVRSPGMPSSRHHHVDPPHTGYLSVLISQVWQEQWCCVCRGVLHFYHERGDLRNSLPSLPLHGCEVIPGLGPKHPFALRILRASTTLASLEVCFTLSIFSLTKSPCTQDDGINPQGVFSGIQL